jgi:hypothetical protein
MVVAFLFLGEMIASTPSNAATSKSSIETIGTSVPDDSIGQTGKATEAYGNVDPAVLCLGIGELDHRLISSDDRARCLINHVVAGALCRAIAPIATFSLISEEMGPSNLNATRCSNCSITLKWTAPASLAGLTAYLVQVSDSSSFQVVLKNITVTSRYNSITVSDLTKDADYYFRVQGVFDGTVGPFSATIRSGPQPSQVRVDVVDTNLLIGTAMVVAILAFLDFMTLYRKMRGRLHH